MPAPTFDEKDLVASICRESYYEFVREFWDTVVVEEPVWNWHVKILCDLFQETMERVFKGLRRKGDVVINISPGTTKSLIFSVFSIPWIWTRMPSAKGIFGSYAYDLALDLSLKARDVVLSDKYKECFPEVRLRRDQAAKGHFATTAGGYRFATAVRGNVTGRHGHFIVVDDPVDPNQAFSETELESSNRWLQHTLPSRKVDKRVAPTFLIMQRLHEGDPTALFLARPNCRFLCLPAELTDGVHPESMRANYIDGLMDVERLPKSVLVEAENDLGNYAYAAQFLQDPSPREGGMFEAGRFKSATNHPTPERSVRFWDKAGTDGGGAYTVGVKMARDLQGSFWVLDVIRVRYDSARREDLIERTAHADGKGVVIGLEQEGGSGGKESAENTVRRLAGFRVRVLKVGKALGDKVTRADPYSTQVNAGNVTLLVGDWNAAYRQELKFFPKGKFKDQVDASSGAFTLLWRKRRRVGGIPGLGESSNRELVRIRRGLSFLG